MPFIRTKPDRRGRSRYQVVETVQTVGDPRQRVLADLGFYSTVAGAIAALEMKVQTWRATTERLEDEARKIQQEYGRPVPTLRKHERGGHFGLVQKRMYWRRKERVTRLLRMITTAEAKIQKLKGLPPTSKQRGGRRVADR